ncbi:MAG: hypothetical protein BRC44_08395 [Cyanobacteria bacterium QS_4_48_99]|nr:MAG: hypothetical protein BRC44_08395 [Cyanobacteria bacterium QS_4_48_99]PSO86074.1 MAG: hypothetical protein BRC45_03235 [Cyanobacteria bacterium QS_5_48_63]
MVTDFLSQPEYKKLADQISKYRKEYYQENLLPKVRPFEKVRELFERVAADGKKIVLASSGCKDTLAKYKQMLHIEDLIDDETSTNEAKKAKPHPDIFQAALDKLVVLHRNGSVNVGWIPEQDELSTVLLQGCDPIRR